MRIKYHLIHKSISPCPVHNNYRHCGSTLNNYNIKDSQVGISYLNLTPASNLGAYPGYRYALPATSRSSSCKNGPPTG